MSTSPLLAARWGQAIPTKITHKKVTVTRDDPKAKTHIFIHAGMQQCQHIEVRGTISM